MRANRRSGFTLVEILIVVVIMAVLAATIIPQFSSSATDAKNSSLAFNLHTLRSQIELYKLHHNGAVPTITSGALPQLTLYTDASGGTNATADTTHVYGPYVQGKLPTNPLNNSNSVIATAAFPPTASTTDGGWLYNETSGQIAPNADGHLED
ncbi:MAG TPA: type II secretion system protein [Pirellulales bacterium]|jgi:prepilin-type N-terminal cleavage/methylation domain-containing protein|nr:type II secretion system protein [Pirellulales bacterium]